MPPEEGDHKRRPYGRAFNHLRRYDLIYRGTPGAGSRGQRVERIRSARLTASPSGAAMPSSISEFLSQLRFPYLFLLTAAVFFLNVLVPDIVPFADEILLGLGTLLLSRLKRHRRDGAG